MITLHISDSEQIGSQITEQWITEQIQNRRKDNADICVQFRVRCNDIDVILSIGKYPTGNGKPIESFSIPSRRLIEYWQERELNKKEVNPGLVISAWKHTTKACN